MSAVSPRSRFGLYLDLIRWDRPAGWLVCLWPTLSALWIAAEGFPGWHLLIVFVLGTILMRSAGCCVNDVADRDFDKHVKRTAQRPVTTGAVSVKEALGLGAVLAIVSFGLVLTTNMAAVLWSVPAVLVAIAYPFTKRIIAMPQAVLGIAFNFGIVIAFAAVQGSVPAVAWWMWLGNLFWVLAYDTEYAMVDRDDDLKIGMKTSAITLGRWDVPVIMLWYAAHTAIWWTVLWQHAGLASADAPGWKLAVWGITLLVAVAQVLWHYALIRTRERERCFRAFTQNHWIGFVVFVAAAALIH